MKPFIPDELPLKDIAWNRLIRLIGKANYELACFEGIVNAIVNPAVLLSPLNTNEAVLSSKIEGTVATLQEVLEYEAHPETPNPRQEDIIEILNYRKAISHAVDQFEKRPITLNLMKELHHILMDSARGQDKARGEFRRTQNWIGKPGCRIEEASFIPPNPSVMIEHLSNWEKYIHYAEEDPIVQLAVIHAQFEIIHPFLDGNGRLGRILIPLFLYEKGLLSAPVFYMSEYLERHREQYYAGLKSITEEKDWNRWIIFFLEALIEQAKINTIRSKAILKLYEDTKREIYSINSSFGLPALDTLFQMPVFTTTDFTKFSDIPKASASRLLNELAHNEVVRLLKEGRGRTPNIYIFEKLIYIADMEVASQE